MNGRGERAQSLIGADVGCGFLAADVLLTRCECQDEAALAFRVDSLPREAARHLANKFFARSNNSGEGSAEAWCQAETLRFHSDDVGFRRSFDHAERHTFGN